MERGVRIALTIQACCITALIVAVPMMVIHPGISFSESPVDQALLVALVFVVAVVGVLTWRRV